MSAPVRKIVIVGGGSAGWITAGLLAAKNRPTNGEGIQICVIESPDIPIIGVGEGTWPTMRTTLRTLGIREADFVRNCHASFKQGSKFRHWRRGDQSEFYYHPFDLPEGFEEQNVAEYWLENGGNLSFSATVCPQEHICERHLAPKQITSPDYGGFSNYGYHLDAGAFSGFLRQHCVEHLGVQHIADTMVGLKAHENGDIESIETKNSGAIAGDLFIDCTGFRSLLLGEHFGVPLKSKSDILFQDTALAVQAPYREGDPVQSSTVATAQAAGWIWDVSLSTRRGVGHVYSSSHMDEESAVTCIREYLGMDEREFAKLSVRKLGIGSGYRETFWKQNCIGIGLSAGFLEPLEASALMLIETSANMVADNMPTTRDQMEDASAVFNASLHKIWDHIIHFLKLHYCLSDREEAFWRDNRTASSMPESLRNDLSLWTQHAPWRDNGEGHVVFPPASYQYVLYGMGFGTQTTSSSVSEHLKVFAQKKFDTVERTASRLTTMLPTNRALLDQINSN